MYFFNDGSQQHDTQLQHEHRLWQHVSLVWSRKSNGLPFPSRRGTWSWSRGGADGSSLLMGTASARGRNSSSSYPDTGNKYTSAFSSPWSGGTFGSVAMMRRSRRRLKIWSQNLSLRFQQIWISESSSVRLLKTSLKSVGERVRVRAEYKYSISIRFLYCLLLL